MKIAYIMRGIQGSGKSTLARLLAGPKGRVHSTDDFFQKPEGYKFDASKLEMYHDLNFTLFCLSLIEDIPIVICDNVNAERKHYERYLQAAREAGYWVATVFIGHTSAEEAFRRNIHNIPLYVIQRTLAKWEYDEEIVARSEY